MNIIYDTSARFVANDTTLWIPESYYPDKQWCKSKIGRIRKVQEIKMGGCKNFKEVIHETMHALGFLHEQQRPDRDSYIKIDWTNLETDDLVNFRKEKGYKLNMDPTNETYIYDYYSIMHWRLNEGAKHANKDVMTPICKVNKERITGNDLSEKDKNKLQFFYGYHNGESMF
ncbi:hatching enzyme-like protein [Leptotrombidium deliense]|uniref:Metalloendopeptidase n=1 Tax=Leptotrombidium deliense TaxID=299467 RepID=A0A443S537_9ACAR|nr:hatching enzyme-like protein [Leptotrombidium deliense]